MKLLHKIACWCGMHVWKRHPEAKTPEQIGQMIAGMSDGMQVLGMMLAAKKLANMAICKHCRKVDP